MAFIGVDLHTNTFTTCRRETDGADWKIVHMPSPYGRGDWQLYNIKEDIGETTDLAKTQPDQLKYLVSLWDEYAKTNGVILPNSVSGY